jgi:hypothetical protein
MKRRKKGKSIFRFFKLIYIKLFRINDSPQKIALGFGLGVFLGILPGTGPIAALFLAFLLRVNRAGALLGSLLTNTWLSIATFMLSIKVGSVIMQMNLQDVHQGWTLFSKNFRWLDLCKLSILKVILPVMLGYFVVAFCAGFFIYLIMLIIITSVKHGTCASLKRNNIR